MYDKMQQFINRTDNLLNQNADTPEFNVWKDDVIRFLTKEYGAGSHEVKAFKKIRFFNVQMTMLSGEFTNDREYQNGLKQAVLCLQSFQNELIENINNNNVKNNIVNNDVFIVHGRNDGVKAEVVNFLSQLGLTSIILNEQANKGRTIIEKFEDHSNVTAAIAIFTADDVGRFKDDKDFETRARQNVIFEAGYFIGKLGREKTIILFEEGLKIPSDLDGYTYVALDLNKRWHFELARDLKAIGLNIDLNKIF